MKICIVRLSALGDIVMMLPLVRTLKDHFPGAKISWVVGSNFAPMIEHLPDVEIIKVGKIRSLKTWLETKKLFHEREFDILIGAQASLSANLFYPLIRAKRKIGFDRKRSNDLHGLFVKERIAPKKEHILDSFLSFAKHLGIEKLSYDGHIPLAKEDYKTADTLSSYYVIHPCSSEIERNWPLERYIQAATEVQKKHPDLRLVVTGAKADKQICDKLAESVPGALNLAGITPLRELAALLAKAKFLLAPDTGPVHIASALKTPVVGLYAANGSTLSGPYYGREYTIDRYEEALFKYSKTKYPKPDRYIRVHHLDIMKLIQVDEVLDMIEKVLVSS